MAWKSIWNRPLVSLLTLLSISLGVGLVAAVLTLRRETDRTFLREQSTFDLVVKVAKDEKTFSSKFGLIQAAGGAIPQDEELKAIRAGGYPAVNTMLTQDPPEQRRYRKLCQKPFSLNGISKYRPYIENLANELIDEFIDQGKCNWMEAFAVPLPVRMIAYILGVPLSDMDLFKAWSDANVYQFAAGQTRDELLKSAQLVVDFQHYFAEKIEDRKIQSNFCLLFVLILSQL